MNYYPITLHMHSVWESKASMEGHFYNAQKLGIRHMYLTDHDCRMGRRPNHIDFFDFSKGLLMINEPSKDPLRPIWNGFSVCEQQEGTSAEVKDNALWLQAEGKGEEWTTVSVEFKTSQKRHECALLAKVMLYLGLKVSAQDEDLRAMIDVKLSQRPPDFEFGRIRYVFGNAEGLESPYAAVIPLKNAGEVTRYELNLLEDAAKVGGGDNVLSAITFSLSARNGKQASLMLNELRFDSELSFEQGRAEQQRLATEIGKKYGVTPFVTSEISSAGPHKNCFSPCVPIINYVELNHRITDAQAMEHVLLNRGIFSRNHPFEMKKDRLKNGVSAEEKEQAVQEVIQEIVENRAWGASMVEVGFPEKKSGLGLQEHLRLWDALSLAGVFISGYGDSDNHTNDKFWFDRDNFVAYIAAEEPSVEGFIEGMLSGNLYSGDPVYLQKASVSFESTEGKRMGQISLNPAPGDAVLRLSGLPEDCRLEWVANGEYVKTEHFSGSYNGSCAIPTAAETNFVRAEVYYKDRCILLTNPIYHISDAVGCKGKILFHIGDVTRLRYAEIMGLIYRIRPDILVHTGDMVDDLKVSRLEADIPAYREWVADLLPWLEKAAGQVYIVPGNNDLVDVIEQNAHTAQILEPQSVLEVGDRKIFCCHRVMDVDPASDAEIFLYGHGPTHDTYSFRQDGKVYANVIYGPTVVSLEDGHCIRMEKNRLHFF